MQFLSGIEFMTWDTDNRDQKSIILKYVIYLFYFKVGEFNFKV